MSSKTKVFKHRVLVLRVETPSWSGIKPEEHA